MVVWGIGTTNKAKVASLKAVVKKCFPESEHIVAPVNIISAVSDQPMSAEEAQKGALHRAEEALKLVEGANYGVGIEAGVEKIGDKWFECAWILIKERSTNRLGIGSSSRLEMSSKLMNPIIKQGKELADVMDELTGEKDIRSGMGAMGVLTGGYLARSEAYEHGIIFALAPFLSDSRFWD